MVCKIVNNFCCAYYKHNVQNKSEDADCSKLRQHLYKIFWSFGTTELIHNVRIEFRQKSKELSEDAKAQAELL